MPVQDQVGTFDPAEVDVVVDGFIITGFADATDSISVLRGEVAWKLVQGTDGASIFIKIRKRGGILLLKLLQSSASNDILSTIANAAEIGLAIPIIVGVVDNNGTSRAGGGKAFIEKMPGLVFGNDENSRNWPILCADLDAVIGGVS